MFDFFINKYKIDEDSLIELLRKYDYDLNIIEYVLGIESNIWNSDVKCLIK